MRRPAKKLNFLIEEAVCKDLEQLVPLGKRSQVVNDALRRELERIRRKNAVERLILSSGTIKRLSTEQIMERLAQDRNSH
jgi:Arc/MetJ-type ribon-helix-helix transcriptional regulator